MVTTRSVSRPGIYPRHWLDQKIVTDCLFSFGRYSEILDYHNVDEQGNAMEDYKQEIDYKPENGN